MIQRVRERLRARAQGDDGFTIVEAVVSILLLLVLSTAVLASVLANVRLADQIRSRTVATELATREVATVRGLLDAGDVAADSLIRGITEQNATPLEGGTVGEDLVVGGTSFTVTRTIGLASGTSGQSLCASGATTLSGADDLMVRVEVAVTWTGRGAFAPIRVVEFAGFPEGLSGGMDAIVVVQVVDPTRAGDGVAGAAVKLEASRWWYSVDAGTTDADGCVVAHVQKAWAQAATYTAVATKTDHVGQAWTATAATSIGRLGYGSGVLINRVQVSYAASASLRVHLTSPDGTTAASDAEVAGQRLTLVCSATGTAASEPGWSTVLTGAVLELPAIWPCLYTAYVGDELPPTLAQVQVQGGTGQFVDIWVRPGHGIVPPPDGSTVPTPTPQPTVEPSPEPSEQPTAQPTAPPTAPPTTAPAPSPGVTGEARREQQGAGADG